MKSILTIVAVSLFFLPATAFAGETTIASYLVDENADIYDLLKGNALTDEEQALADDTDVHAWMWEQIVGVAGEEFVADHVSGFDLFTDTPDDDTLAYVVQDSWDLDYWIIAFDIEDALADQAVFEETIIHEFTHILTLEPDQVDVAYDVFEWGLSELEYEERKEDAIADCETYFTGEGCAKEDSYIYAFVEEFWADWIEWNGLIDTNFNELDFYTGNESDFITWYAATNPGEDIAESFTFYVLYDEITGDDVKHEKLRFFSDYPELVELRSDIRAFLSLETVDDPTTDQVVDDGAVEIIAEPVEESAETASLINRLAGQIMLLVDRDGEAWYIDPVTRLRFYLADGPTAYEFLRAFGLGITNADLEQIPTSDNAVGGGDLAEQLAGRILLQVEENGEAWYVNPTDLKRYYMADGDAAYTIMRELSEGTLVEWIENIGTGYVR